MENSNPFKIGDRFPEVTVLRRSAPKRSRRIIVVVGLFYLAIRGISHLYARPSLSHSSSGKNRSAK